MSSSDHVSSATGLLAAACERAAGSAATALAAKAGHGDAVSSEPHRHASTAAAAPSAHAAPRLGRPTAGPPRGRLPTSFMLEKLASMSKFTRGESNGTHRLCRQAAAAALLHRAFSRRPQEPRAAAAHDVWQIYGNGSASPTAPCLGRSRFRPEGSDGSRWQFRSRGAAAKRRPTAASGLWVAVACACVAATRCDSAACRSGSSSHAAAVSHRV